MPKPIDGPGPFRPCCLKETPPSPGKISVLRCLCGIYHLRIDATMIDLTSSQFLTVARLFKLTLGALAGRGPTDPLVGPSHFDQRG